MRITAPSHRECGNVSAYFSGHHCTYGVNVQAVCDAVCHVYFYSLAAPGKTNDNIAIKKTSIPAWLNSLPPVFLLHLTVHTHFLSILFHRTLVLNVSWRNATTLTSTFLNYASGSKWHLVYW